MTETWVPESTFGSRLSESRKAAGLTAEEAALRSGIAPSTWSSWERGDSPRDFAGIAQKIEEGIGLDHVYLLTGHVRGGPGAPQRLSRELEYAGQTLEVIGRLTLAPLDPYPESGIPGVSRLVHSPQPVL